MVKVDSDGEDFSQKLESTYLQPLVDDALMMVGSRNLLNQVLEVDEKDGHLQIP